MPTGLRARDAARAGARDLRDAGVPEPEASAEVLLSELLGVRRGEIPLHEPPLTDEQARLYGRWIGRRADREPVQRILGYAYFRNLVLTLNEETLIPRPDTEGVVDAALELLDARGASGAVLDGGPDGLRFYRRIFDEAPPLLESGADVVLEVGDGQGEDILDLGREAGFAPLGLREDLAGTPRAALLRWEG